MESTLFLFMLPILEMSGPCGAMLNILSAEEISKEWRFFNLLSFSSEPCPPIELRMGACSLVKSGLNLRKDEQAIASWTIPSCQRNAAKTALAHSATDGDMACFTGSVTLDVLSPLNRGPDLSFLGRVCRLEVLRLTLGEDRLSISSLTGALPMLKCTLQEPSSALRTSTFSSLPSSLERSVLEVHTSTTSL